jgi:hypothetical protein
VGAGGHEDDGVVRRHAAVGVEAVEGLVRRGTQSLVEHGLVEFRVGGDDDEHRRQAGCEHARAFGHAADREPAGPVRVAVFATVSVVMIASAADCPASTLVSAAATSGARLFTMESRKSWPPTPMSPVEQTSTSSACVSVPASVRSSAVVCAVSVVVS